MLKFFRKKPHPMKIKNTLCLLLMLAFSISFAQKTAKCKCPKTEFVSNKTGTVFQFTDGNRIIACGGVDADNDPPTYSEFILAQCGKKNIIDFWNANKICEIELKNDTLYVQQVESLPVGKGYSMEYAVWSVEKIYFYADQIMRKIKPNKSLRKYKPTEIKAVNKLYEVAKTGEVNEKKMELANKLFIAAISGSQKSREYLLDFKEKFKVEESDYIDQYNEIIAKLEFWDN